MLPRINILTIIRDHFRTLRRLGQKSSRVSWQDFSLFVLVPFFIAIFLCFKNFNYHQQTGNLITAISIFGGFLFNLLAIIYSQIDRLKRDSLKENSELKKRFVNEIHINISYCIVLSIAIVLVLLLSTIDYPKDYTKICSKAVDTCAYFLMGQFLLTLLMVLNRVYILLKKDSE